MGLRKLFRSRDGGTDESFDSTAWVFWGMTATTEKPKDDPTVKKIYSFLEQFQKMDGTFGVEIADIEGNFFSTYNGLICLADFDYNSSIFFELGEREYWE